MNSAELSSVEGLLVDLSSRFTGLPIESHFREDLYFRLSVFPIRLPPLRERREHIPILVWAKIDRRQTPLGRRIERVPTRAIAALRAYALPGNIRELENVIERALILSAR
jgi:transcriptional regulator with GAF, ATPase, and Fis domain